MSFIRVYIHFVWSTKNREPFLETKTLRNKLWFHIKENAIENDIVIDHIGGYKDHCHCLVSMGWKFSISQIMKMIKGESSKWINDNGLIESTFSWQNEYYAVGVSNKELDKTRAYIRNQEEHHKSVGFDEEIKRFKKFYD
ncbi:MAG: IS200/IS605 family transposase [Bacteroidia bacterium]